MNLRDLFKRMREGHTRLGTEPTTPIRLNAFYNEAAVQAAINDLERTMVNVAAGLDVLTPRDKLLLELLMDSAGIERNHIQRDF